MSDITLPMFTLGDRLAKAREHAGIGVQEMADLLVVSRSTISNYEHGRSPLPLEVVLGYSRATNVPLSWFVGDSDMPTSRSDLYFGVVGAAA